jgi:serine/threonine protein kinase
MEVAFSTTVGSLSTRRVTSPTGQADTTWRSAAGYIGTAQVTAIASSGGRSFEDVLRIEVDCEDFQPVATAPSGPSAIVPLIVAGSLGGTLLAGGGALLLLRRGRAPQPVPAPGRRAAERLGGYRLKRRLGTGGMGTVWQASEAGTGRDVAIKLLHPHLANDPEYVRRFEREAQIARSIKSPNVVGVLGSGHDGNSYFLVMEYVDGNTLAGLLRRTQRLDPAQAVAFAGAIASGLQAAHARGIVHRDISPQNVMIAADGTVKVTDFGVARDTMQASLTATSVVLGKPQYLAPEVIAGRSRPDIRADIYALGVVLYQMLAGEVPFVADTPWQMMQAHVHDPPPNIATVRPDVPRWLAAIVSKCLAKDPARRFQTPGELLAALQFSGSGGAKA